MILAGGKGLKYPYSRHSLDVIATCDTRLQSWAFEMANIYDLCAICGFRSPEAQALAYRTGKSKARPGQSKHNENPSLALDIAPVEAVRLWKIDRDLPKAAYVQFAKDGLKIAETQGLTLRWGGDWDGDGDFTDQQLMDYVHFEIMED